MIKIFKNLDLQNLDGEIWKDILDYDGDYQVSNLGRVKSFKRYRNGKILKQCKNSTGRFQINLWKNKKPETKSIHRLVYEAFKEKLEEGYDAHHINEDEEDNYVENLESKPHSEHISFHRIGKSLSEEHKNKIREKSKGRKFSEEHRKNLSESKKGKNHPNFKMINQKIIDIMIDIEKRDLNQCKIAKKYGVSNSIVSNIKTGKIKVSE